MTMAKLARCLSVGFLFAIIGIGLLPFLFVYFLTDINGLTEFDTTPLYVLITKFLKGSD